MSWLPTGVAHGWRQKDFAAAARELRRQRTELARVAMLESLEGATTQAAARLARRARGAVDAEQLWYLRADLMTALASTYGEAAARRKLADISALFQEMLPAGLTCRPAGADAASSGFESL